MSLLSLALAFVVGTLITLQIGSNARLKEAIGHPLPAVIISSALGIVVLVGAMLVGRVPWPSLDKLSAAPGAAWFGGLFGAAYAIVTIVLARHIGAATLVALVVAGQLICSVVVDHVGIVGFDVRPITVWRGAGCALLLAGLFLIWKF